MVYHYTMPAYVVAVSNLHVFNVEMHRIDAASELEAVIVAMRPLEGFEDWPWERFKSLKELRAELSSCDFAVGVTKV